MRAVAKKWGNSASVRIPAAVMRAAHVDLDDPVGVRQESGRIIIEPLLRKEYDLDELVKRITRENLHAEADFGRPGKAASGFPARESGTGQLDLARDKPALVREARHALRFSWASTGRDRVVGAGCERPASTRTTSLDCRVT